LPKKKVNENIEPVIRKPSITISEIKSDFKELKKIKPKVSHSNTNNRKILLDDIKETLDEVKKDENIEQNIELSDIFKTNIALQNLLNNKIFTEHIEYIEIDDHYVTYVGA